MLLAVGVPVAITLAVTGFVFGYLGFGSLLFNLLPARIFGVTANYTLIAIPLFVFMGVMLEKSRIADELMDVIGHLAGGLRGGMAIGIVVFGVLMGATTGIVGATIITLGLLSLPTLMRRGYHLPTACGTICASGARPAHPAEPHPDPARRHLRAVGRHSLRRGDAAGPDARGDLLRLSAPARRVQARAVPPLPIEERDALSRGDLFRKVMRAGVPPLALVVSVLGSIIGGVAAPTEAASMGALGSILVVAIAGRFKFSVLRETVRATTRITAQMMFILVCAQVFALSSAGCTASSSCRTSSPSCRAASTARLSSCSC